MGRIRSSIVAIICVLVFSLTACGSDTSSSAGGVSKSKETQSTDENTKSNKKEDSKEVVRIVPAARIHREHQVLPPAPAIPVHQEVVLRSPQKERLRLISVSIPQRRMARYLIPLL